MIETFYFNCVQSQNTVFISVLSRRREVWQLSESE